MASTEQPATDAPATRDAGALRHWLGAFAPAAQAIDARERLRIAVGAGLGILVTALLCQRLAPAGSPAWPWLVAPLGASAVLVFGVPASPLAQPWAVLGGNMLSALVGIACVRWIEPTALAAAVGVGSAISLMLALRCLHPPGGALALLTVLAGVTDPWFAIFPVAINSLLLVALPVVDHSHRIIGIVTPADFMRTAEVLLNDRPVRYFVPASAVRDGITYVTEDRKIEGFFETQSIAGNVYLGLLAKLRSARTLVSRKEASDAGTSWIKRLNIRAISQDVKAIELSGGNQQKVVIAKSLIQEPELIIFDEPTRGVDVGAITEIHQLINRLADEGKAVVVISSYLPEVMALSDRILVQRMGKVVEEYSALEATEEKIMYAAIH